MLPSLQLLEKVSQEIMSVPNRRKESKRKIHRGLFLLGYKSGLRISEAVSFDLANKTPNGLYRIERTKGKKERLVYVPKEVIRELVKQNWKPNQTNRFNFYHFLKKIKWELNISKNVELTPHTLRRNFATYQAESGMPLPLLQKLLGHSSIRTTALYWRNIYQEPDDDVGGVLTGKIWLESKEPPPTTENFPEPPKTPKPIFIERSPVIPNTNPTHVDNSLSTPKTIKKTLEILTNEISPASPAKFSLNPASKKSDQLKISQPPSITSNQEQKPTKKELILLQKIKLLKKQNTHLKSKNHHLKALIQQFQERQSLFGDQKNETNAQIIQPPP